MKKINFSIVLALAAVSQQALAPLNNGQIRFIEGKNLTNLDRLVPNWQTLATPEDVMKAYDAAKAPAKAPAPAAPSQTDADAARRAREAADAEARRRAEEANRRAAEEANRRAAEEANRRAAEARIAGGQSNVAKAAQGKSNDVIAGAAFIKLQAAGYKTIQELEAAAAMPEAKNLANDISKAQQSHTLGRLGKPAKKDKHNKRYAH